MTDIVDSGTRSRMMSRIGSRDTRIEVSLRKALFARGFRYRKNVRQLPGSPDIVLPKYRAAVFVHGCFWHGHDCSLFRLPASRPVFWRTKIDANRARDARAGSELAELNWRVAVVWECALRGRDRLAGDAVVDTLVAWITDANRDGCLLIRGIAQ